MDGTSYYTLDLEKPSPVSGKSRLYRKQVIYATDFASRGANGKWVDWSITDEWIDRWVDNINLFLSRGIEIPMPKGHTSDPELKRARVVGAEKGLDHKGRPSLYAYVEFLDDEAEKALKNSNVSIHSPPEFTDANKNKYTRPVLHIAFTDYPVIPDLQPFEAIAASLIPREELDTMNEALVSIAEALGVTLTEDADDTAALNVILNAIEQLKKAAGVEDVDELPEDGEEEETPIAASHPPYVLSIARRAREAEINALVTSKHLSPAAAQEMKKQWCGKDITLSNDGTDSMFDGIISVMKKNRALRDESTGPQTSLQLGHSMGRGDKSESPLVRQAREKAEAAKQRR